MKAKQKQVEKSIAQCDGASIAIFQQKNMRGFRDFVFVKHLSRPHLPWRRTRDPYKILVSEMMLQQTQVSRVCEKYRKFIEVFPNIGSLASAPLGEVLGAWQGLGYNRRAKFLHEAAKIVARDFGGKLPKDPTVMEKLPGIGHYTARAVAAFAYNAPEVFVETNIRTVFLLHGDFSPKRSSGLPSRRKRLAGQTIFFEKPPLRSVSDGELLPLVEKILKESKMQPREFYAALMDYGSYLKKQGVKLNSKSKHYTKQSKFEGSARQLRGALLRELLQSPATLKTLQKKSARTPEEVERELLRLTKEGLVTKRGQRFSVPG